jgi:hypothetical protein
VVIDSYKPMDLTKRKVGDVPKNAEDSGVAAWSNSKGLEDVKSVTSKEENLENSVDSNVLLN